MLNPLVAADLRPLNVALQTMTQKISERVIQQAHIEVRPSSSISKKLQQKVCQRFGIEVVIIEEFPQNPPPQASQKHALSENTCAFQSYSRRLQL